MSRGRTRSRWNQPVVPRHRAFTLVEVIVAAAVISLLLAGLWALLDLYLRLESTASRTTHEAQLVRAVQSHVERDILSIVLPMDQMQAAQAAQRDNNSSAAAGGEANDASSYGDASSNNAPDPDPDSRRDDTAGSPPLSLMERWLQADDSSTAGTDDALISGLHDEFARLDEVWSQPTIGCLGTAHTLVLDVLESIPSFSSNSTQSIPPQPEPVTSEAAASAARPFESIAATTLLASGADAASPAANGQTTDVAQQRTKRVLYAFAAPETAAVAGTVYGLVRIVWSPDQLRHVQQLETSTSFAALLMAAAAQQGVDNMPRVENGEQSGPVDSTAADDRRTDLEDSMTSNAEALNSRINLLGPRDAARFDPALWEAVEFVPEVAAWEFRYFDGSTWLTQWDSRRRKTLPVAVEVRFAMRSPARDSSAKSEPAAEGEGNARTDVSPASAIDLHARSASSGMGSGVPTTADELAADQRTADDGSAALWSPEEQMLIVLRSRAVSSIITSPPGDSTSRFREWKGAVP